MNLNKKFTDSMAYFGVVYDLKQASNDAIMNRNKRNYDENLISN